jgi:uncharacterized protein YndB with AHSA1/START domain
MVLSNDSAVISIQRVYNAPIASVWQAWTSQQEVCQWWGPRGFTLTTHSHDLQTGGHWHYTMHGPDGTEFENTTQYLEVIPLQSMVYDHGGHKDRPPLFRVTARFSEEAGGRTQLDMSMAFESAQVAAQMKLFIRQAGGETTWDRLAEYLAKQYEATEVFVLARSFSGTIEQLYSAWTSPERLAQWLPPTGASMRFLRAQAHVGGSSFYEMAHQGARPMYGLLNYHELRSPSRLVYTQQFCDEHETVIRPSFFTHWPLCMRTTIELVAESQYSTRVALRWEPADATHADIAEFVNQRASMTAGWTGSFDKLDALLL